MRVIVMLGGPGSGKGTQAPVLVDAFGFPHISTGDLFRAEARAGTPLGLRAKTYMDRGELVPDDVTVDLLLDRLERPDARTGAILDGFPRTRAQAAALDAALGERGSAVEDAILIDVPADELVRRLSGRWICEAEGHVYNLVTQPPRVAGSCDEDGSRLIQRSDDRPETVRARLASQLEELDDVVDHYRGRGVLRTIDGRGTVDDVSAKLLAAIEAVDGDPA
jgi:adenylate kinase